MTIEPHIFSIAHTSFLPAVALITSSSTWFTLFTHTHAHTRTHTHTELHGTLKYWNRILE